MATIPVSPDYLKLYEQIFVNNPNILNEYIALYNKIFVFDQAPAPAPGIEKGQTQKALTRKYFDLSKLDVPSIYANIFQGQTLNSPEIKANGLNIGDGYSYVDFYSDPPFEVIHFYRRELMENGKYTLLPMHYNTQTTNLTATLPNKQIYEFKAIQPQLQAVLQKLK